MKTLSGTATVKEINQYGAALIKHNMPAGNGQEEWMSAITLRKEGE